MGKKRVTAQDIADALGVSRNTVSKALNNTGVLSDTTRKNVLRKAAEMGYRSFSYSAEPLEKSVPQVREFVLFTQEMPTTSHFGSFLLDTFQKKISMHNCRLSIYVIRRQEIETLSLPLGFHTDTVSGIICIELFDPDYTRMLSELGIPLLLVDAGARTDFSAYQADFLFMENRNSVYRLTDTLIRHGCQKLAFAGNIFHCQSFYERYLGFNDALLSHGLTCSTSLFTTDNVFPDSDRLHDAISNPDILPDVFVCANDFVAIDLIRALKKHSIRVPEDVFIVGFDNAPESRIIEPHLTTVHIPGKEMGEIAADLLLARVAHPEAPYRITYVNTTPKYRESTGTMISV